jgi:tetratricopeptide (TPR) repeat protein
MKTMMSVSAKWIVCALLALPVLAQSEAGEKPKAMASQAGREALVAGRELGAKVRGLRGPERTAALEAAAKAHDEIAVKFAAEPGVAAQAAFTAGELWRQQGSLALAEKGYLLAVQLDGARFAQRGLLGAADMQRRQKRADEAMTTYGRAAAIDPGSARAQDARLWQARLLQDGERLDEAIVAFQGALESADPGPQTIEACNFLALAWIQKGDFDAASRAIEHAVQAVMSNDEEDPIVQDRLQKSLESMSAKKALQRARDKQNEVGKDAAALETARAGK